MTTPDVHIYTRPWQPATRFVDTVAEGVMGKRIIIRFASNRLLPAHCCRKRRPAKNLRVQVYYDTIRVACKPGKGCNR